MVGGQSRCREQNKGGKKTGWSAMRPAGRGPGRKSLRRNARPPKAERSGAATVGLQTTEGEVQKADRRAGPSSDAPCSPGVKIGNFGTKSGGFGQKRGGNGVSERGCFPSQGQYGVRCPAIGLFFCATWPGENKSSSGWGYLFQKTGVKIEQKRQPEIDALINRGCSFAGKQ